MITLLLKSSFSIILLLAFYKLFLEKESFFAVNRVYLLACLGLTFLLPFIILPKLIEHQGYVETLIEPEKTNSTSTVEAVTPPNFVEPIEKTAPIERIAPIEQPKTISEIAVDKTKILSPEIVKHNNKFENLKTTLIHYLQANTLADWLLLFYFFGVTILSLNLLAQIANMLSKIIKNEDKIKDDDGIIVNMNAVIEPCSFFNYIFINPASYDFETYEQIIAHEKIHVAKGHTYDLLLAELAVIVLWFNPFIWLFRKEVEKNIEYQTDDLVVNSELAERENYQMSLLKIATYNKPLTVVTNYNQSLIKQRILKMNSKQSTQFSYWKYAFLAPLLFAILLFLNKPIEGYATANNTLNDLAESTINIPVEPPISKEESERKKVEPTTNIVQDDIVDTSSKTIEKEPIVEEIQPTIASKSNQKIVEKTDCEKLLNAVKAGDEEKIRELLKTFNPDCMPYAVETDYQNMKVIKEVAKSGGEIVLDQVGGTIVVQIGRQKYAIISLNELVEGKFVSDNLKDTYNLQNSGDWSHQHVDIHSTSTEENNRISENYIYDNDCQLLLKAVRNNDNKQVKILLKTIDPNCVNPNEEYEEIVENGHTWRFHKARTPLVAAARNGNFEGGKLLIAAGAKVYFHHRNEESPIIAASEFGQLAFVKFLLEKGAALNESSNAWGSPLNAAARGGHTEIVDFLIAEGAPLNEQTNGQGSALNAAARKGHLETVQLLIAKGANLNMQNNGQGSALNAAARNGHLKVAKLLIEAGADIDVSTNGQGSALNAAARNGHLSTAKLLINEGADVNGMTNGQGTALMAATKNGMYEMVELLLKNGADPYLSPNHQESPNDRAHKDRDKRMIKLFDQYRKQY